MALLDRVRNAVSTRSGSDSSQETPGTYSTLRDQVDSVELDIEDALDALANERRRLAIRYAIEEADATCELDDLTRYIVTQQCGPNFSSQERKAVYIALYQSHMSTLLDVGAFATIPDDRAHTYRVQPEAYVLYHILREADAVLTGGDA